MTITGGGQVVSSGAINITSSTSGTVFTLSAGQYAILNIRGYSTGTSAVVSIGIGGTSFQCGSSGATGQVQTPFLSLMAGPGQAVTYFADATSLISLTWVIFQNS
jgi:hypothetical protein